MQKMGELLERLVSDLPGLGGWPKWADECILHRGSCKAMFYDGAGRFQDYPSFPDIKFKEEALVERIVYREMYEAALAASNPEWDGEGLPPMGCEFEFRTNVNSSWKRGVMCVVDYTNPFNAVVDDQCGIYRTHELEFRPIRSEADKKRDEAIDTMEAIFIEATANGANGQRAVFTAVYDAIKSGKIAIE